MADAADASPLTLYTLAVNFCLGAGVLGLPYAVATAGILCSVLSLAVVGGLSLLTCSWLLEVGDRANALQNEVFEATRHGISVAHADGTFSLLPPAEAFISPPAAARAEDDLGKPLLDKPQHAAQPTKLDEYRAAYRSWRQGGAQGARDSQLRTLLPMLTGVYQESRHRQLLPLQLLPPPRPSQSAAASDAELVDAEADALISLAASSTQPSRPLSSATSRAESTNSLDAAGRSSSLRRQTSFSVDLAQALLQLPGRFEGGEGQGAERAGTGADVEAAKAPPAVPKPRLPRSPSEPKLRTRSHALHEDAPTDGEADGEATPPHGAAATTRPNWAVPQAISALEVTQLCTLFLGWRARVGWIASIGALHVAAMWACCAVWVTCAQDAVQWLGIAPTPSLLLGLCAAVLVPLSALDGTEVVQPPLATATLGTLALMCALLGWALLERGSSAAAGGGTVFGAPTVSNAPTLDPSDGGGPGAEAFRRLLFDGRGFGRAFATFLFSFILQQSVPSLMRRAATPAATRRCVAAAIATCAGLYLALGCSAALLFGPRHTAPLITLNFGAFRGGAPPGAAVPLWALLVARWVMLLPLLTTTAAFPLFNRVLAVNLQPLLPGELKSRRVAAALCALPPLVCTAAVHDTAVVFSLCGLCGFAVVFFVPAALQYAAMRATVRRWGAELGHATPHTTVLSGPRVVLAVLAFSISAFGYNAWTVVVRPVLGIFLSAS